MDECKPLPHRGPEHVTDMKGFISLASQVSIGYRRKLKLTAKFEGGSSYDSFKCFFAGAFNVGLIGSSCSAQPWRR